MRSEIDAFTHKYEESSKLLDWTPFLRACNKCLSSDKAFEKFDAKLLASAEQRTLAQSTECLICCHLQGGPVWGL